MDKRFLDTLWGIYVVFKKEFLTNLKSIRMIILMSLFSLFVLLTVYTSYLLMGFAGGLQDADLSEIIINQGPVFILGMVVGVVSFIGPIIALALSFDTIVKEKIQNSISLLLCRPVSKRSIATGKYLGILSALAVPVFLVNVIAIIIIGFLSGKNITFTQALGFIIFTLIFLATYAAIGQMISSLVKTTGTAILAGIGIWFLFWMFLPIITAIIGFVGTSISDQIGLINPATSYSACVNSVLGLNDNISNTVIPLWGYYATFVIWFIGSFLLSVEIFNRKEN
jgi:ABC-type transport system involved in multi-copper enzyme maturation permease subunit